MLEFARLRFTPRSLLARTALVIVLALIASQVVSVLLFRYYSQQPRNQNVATGYVSHLKTIRAALETIPPAQHRDFMAKLREERGIRLMPAQRFLDDPLEPAPNVPAVRAARERLRELFGPEADIFVFQRAPRPGNSNPKANAAETRPAAAFVTKLPVGDTHYWVLFPQNRVVEQDFSMAWIGWGVFGGLLALAGALFLVSRVNRPLHALSEAARQIGQGQNPPPVTEMGPDEVKSVAVAFNQMRDDLKRLDQERANFLAGVSHDVRTPLSRLRLGLEMLPADPATRADLENDIDDINGVIDQFMNFARDESRETPMPTDLNVLVQNSANRARRSGANVQFDAAPQAIILLRPLAMQRLIDNLVDNALKHGGKDISLVTRVDGANVILSVLDRGPGIAPQDVERLKQPFTRLDASRSGQSGAGLGLAIVERIAKIHGGRIDLLGRNGGGCEARVTIPNG